MITKEKVKDFIEEHKVALTVAAVSIAGVAMCVATKGKSGKFIDIDRPELTTGEWKQLFRVMSGNSAGATEGCVDAIDLVDLGKFGDALATIEGIDPHEPIRIVFGTAKHLPK